MGACTTDLGLPTATSLTRPPSVRLPGREGDQSVPALPGQLLPRRSRRGLRENAGQEVDGQVRAGGQRVVARHANKAMSPRRRRDGSQACTDAFRTRLVASAIYGAARPGVLNGVRVTGGDTRQGDRRVITCCPAEVTRSSSRPATQAISAISERGPKSRRCCAMLQRRTGDPPRVVTVGSDGDDANVESTSSR